MRGCFGKTIILDLWVDPLLDVQQNDEKKSAGVQAHRLINPFVNRARHVNKLAHV